MNDTFVRKMVVVLCEYVGSDFIKRYPGFNRTFNRLCVACHLTMISQNFAECKHNLKKKGILILATDEHGDIQRGWHPQPIIAAGIRKCQRKNLGIKTRFCNIVIQIDTEEFNKLTIKQKSKYSPVKIRVNPWQKNSKWKKMSEE